MKRNRITLECPICSSMFELTPCKIRATNCCSRQCQHILCSSNATISKPCKVCGISMKIRRSEEDRISTCSKLCQQLSRRDENNPRWISGKSRTTRDVRLNLMSRTDYKDWRKAVYERDNYTCVFCGQKGGDLQADHIKPWAYFPDLRYNINNGRTLCLSCHRKTFKSLKQYRDGLIYENMFST